MRHPEWVRRLRETVAAHSRKAFAYGTQDCALFSARCVDAVTGSLWTRTLVYGTLRGAAKFRKSEGGIEAAVTKRLGAPIENGRARRGDICLINKNTLGVCMGVTVAVLSDRDVTHLPRARITKHWRVG